MLKLEVKSLGESLLLVPRDEEMKLLDKKGLKKNEICSRIANHYIRILYVLCLIKYVYNLEQDGQLSIAGIIFRHITITKNTLKIIYCNLEQKNLKSFTSGNFKDILNLDISGLVGLRFFVEYVLEREEATIFMRTLRHILARKSQGIIKNDFCDIGKDPEINDLYKRRFSQDLVCNKNTQNGGNIELIASIQKENPIFDSTWCYGLGHVTIPLAEPEGKEAIKLYKQMRARYTANIKSIENILGKLVDKTTTGSYKLKDITKEQLDDVIALTKKKVTIFYLQSIVDFQDLLDRVKTFPNAIIG
jgi:hypothetical protein